MEELLKEMKEKVEAICLDSRQVTVFMQDIYRFVGRKEYKTDMVSIELDHMGKLLKALNLRMQANERWQEETIDLLNKIYEKIVKDRGGDEG